MLMANKKKGRAVKASELDSQAVLRRWIWALGILILVGGVWAWYVYIHQGAYNVFWATIDNNLRTSGVTRRVEQSEGLSSVDQTLQVFLGSQNLVRGHVSITQPDTTGGTTTVTSEVIGTPTSNYARYTDIKVAGDPDLSTIKDVWSKELLVGGQSQNRSLFAEGIFSSMPFSNLTQGQRQEAVQFMKDNSVYEVDYKGAQKVERAGKQAYEYKVNVNLAGYIGLLKKLDGYMGLGQLDSVDPAQFEDASDANLTVVFSIDGRQLLEVTYDGATRKETYSGYGANTLIDIPEASLPRSELEQRVQEIFSQSGN